MGRIEVFHKFKRLNIDLEYQLYNRLTKIDRYSKDFYFQLVTIKRLIRDINCELFLINHFEYKPFEVPEIEKLKYQYSLLTHDFYLIEKPYKKMMGETIYYTLILRDL